MPYLTYVGPDYERHGSASRGYWVFRRGSHVVTRFGSITIERGRTYRIKWRYGGYNERVIACKSVKEAAALVNQIVKDKTHQRHAYRRMLAGQKIYE